MASGIMTYERIKAVAGTACGGYGLWAEPDAHNHEHSTSRKAHLIYTCCSANCLGQRCSCWCCSSATYAHAATCAQGKHGNAGLVSIPFPRACGGEVAGRGEEASPSGCAYKLLSCRKRTTTQSSGTSVSPPTMPATNSGGGTVTPGHHGSDTGSCCSFGVAAVPCAIKRRHSAWRVSSSRATTLKFIGRGNCAKTMFAGWVISSSRRRHRRCCW